MLFAMLAMLSAARGDWPALFAWLGVTLIIDGLDGPLARWSRTEEAAPRHSGAIMDWVIDYVTYVFIPAYVMIEADLMPSGWNVLAAGAVLVTGVFYFSDVSQKTDSYHFRGFPAVWNMVLLYLFIWDAPQAFNVALVLGLAGLTFAPIDFVHPTRVTRLRTLTLAVSLAAIVLSVLAILADLAPSAVVVWALTLCGAYAWAIGLYETWRLSVHDRA